ncbi:MAG TPA: ATP-binding protein, partial [Burkholderiaceae bacterium]
RLDPVLLPLDELLDDVEHMVRPQAQAKGLRFSIQREGEVPAWVRADAKRLRQILLNLLTNAVRFTEEGEVLLRLDFRHHVARIDVADTGIGIAPQDQERIFLPFERGSAGRRASEAGTGLGLTITHLLTGMMGGELTVYSQPGQGSTFTMRLYLPGATPEPGHPPPAGTVLRPVTGYRGPRRTLLVVDDQPLHRQLIAGLLVPLGFIVREAASGRECLEIVQRDPPELVLLDITMDDLDGWQTAALLRELLPASRLPVVFVSANLFDYQTDRLAALDCQGFVAKPVMESELLAALAHALHLEWLRDAAPGLPALPVPALSAAGAPLPQELREDLLRLARQGQGPALRQRLWQARDTWPGCTPTLAQLQACADRFDFQALIEQLRHLPEEPCDDPIDA